MCPSLGLETTKPREPPAPGGPTFQFQVQVRLPNAQQGALRVETVEELMAICAVLQIPTGQLFFEPNGQTLIKSA